MSNNSFSFDQPLSNDEQTGLRVRGALSESEVAVRAGDLLIAVDTLTGARRSIKIDNSVNESSNRRVLRD